MNVECGQTVIDELITNFRYNDAVLRHLIIRTDGPVTVESPIMKAEKEARENRDRPCQQKTVEIETVEKEIEEQQAVESVEGLDVDESQQKAASETNLQEDD